jgi:hypothetical protein
MSVVACYLSYLAISVVLTIWVAHILHRSGRVFLLDAFSGNEALADSINQLLVVAFYLVNAGYIALALKTDQPLLTVREMIEIESTKLGIVLLILGAMPLFNMFILVRVRRHTRLERLV